MNKKPDESFREWEINSSEKGLVRHSGRHLFLVSARRLRAGDRRHATALDEINVDFEPLSSWVSHDPPKLPGLISNSCPSPKQSMESSPLQVGDRS